MNPRGQCQWSQTCAGGGTYTVRSKKAPGPAFQFTVCEEHRDASVAHGYHPYEPDDDAR